FSISRLCCFLSSSECCWIDLESVGGGGGCRWQAVASALPSSTIPPIRPSRPARSRFFVVMHSPYQGVGGLGKTNRLSGVARAGRQPGIGVHAGTHEAHAAVAQQHIDPARVVAARRGDQLPPVIVGSPTGSIRGQQMVIPVAPNIAFVPRVPAIPPG